MEKINTRDNTNRNAQGHTVSKIMLEDNTKSTTKREEKEFQNLKKTQEKDHISHNCMWKYRLQLKRKMQ